MHAASMFVLLLLMVGVSSNTVSADEPPAVRRESSEVAEPRKANPSIEWKPTASWLASRGKAPAPRLAILVAADDANISKLQELLEEEASRGWHGEILDRVQRENILRELPHAAIDREANALKLGQLTQADYLLIARIEDDRVRCRVNHFPSTAVVVEFDVDRVAEDRLAKQITHRALRAIAERSRDQSRITVAIGSFLVDDLFSNYTDLDQNLHVALRERLSKIAQIDLAERFHPTQLLREFELARAGLVPSLMARLTAPASDALILGDVRPTARQELNRKDVELEYRIRVISPTGLFEPFDVRFLLPNADANDAADQIATAVRTLLTRLPETPVRKADAVSLATEFESLKQRAFKLLPSPPMANGDFYSNREYVGSLQSGPPLVIERATRAVENALLLKGDDSQLLVCATLLLHALAESETSRRPVENPTPRQRALIELCCDYIEMALALNFNENSRGITYNVLIGSNDFWYASPDRTRSIIARMIRDGVAEGWYPHQVEAARSKLIENAPDLSTKIELFQIAEHDSGSKSESRFRRLGTIVDHYLKLRDNKAEVRQLREAKDQLLAFADELGKQESALSRGMAHYVRVYVSYYTKPRDPLWKAELREAIDLIPAVSTEDGPELAKQDYTLRVYDFVRWSNEKSPTKAARALLRHYIARQVEANNYEHGQLPEALSLLLPRLKSEVERTEGLQLLMTLLERYNYGGSADYDRMRLARWRNHLQQSLSETKGLTRDRLVQIKLEPVEGQTRVKKILWAFDHLWAIRCDYYLQDWSGDIHRFAPTETVATKLQGLSSRITDLAAANDQLAVASIDCGLDLIDRTGQVVRQLRPANSPLPTAMVRAVASDGLRFTLGLPGRDDTGNSYYFLYDLAPKADTLQKTTIKLDYREYYQSCFDKVANQFAFQTWDSRFHEVEADRWTFRKTADHEPIHTVTVIDAGEKPIFAYTGFELNYVYDFVRWQDRLIFATGNGLYVARPGTDKLKCLLSELELEFSSLCPVGDKLFIGTNKGLFRLDATVLAESE
jgi:hypothetical protein